MWRSHVLHLPDILWKAYSDVLEGLGLQQKCLEGTKNQRIHGGASEQEADDHFTYRFANSVSRLCFLIECAEPIFQNVSDAIKISFGSNEICILDLAAGTGAGVISILTALHDLRRSKSLPQQPLSVYIIAADISLKALNIYQTMIEEISPSLSQVGINVVYESNEWDASDVASTNILCSKWLLQSDRREAFVLVSNLSGVGKETFGKFQRSFQHITERSSNIAHTLLWVEPSNSSATNFLKKVGKAIFDAIPWLEKSAASGVGVSYLWFHKLQLSDKTISGGVQILSFIRSPS